MDTLTHALSGAVLARALSRAPQSPPAQSARARAWFGPRVPLWQAVLVGFVTAGFPDIDFVLGFISEVVYLRGHRGVTHSVLLLPLWALALGGLFAVLLRNRAAWKRYSWLAAGGIAIHIAGDWITQFGTMLLTPASDARFGLGAVFIIDLVLSGILLAGLIASLLWRRSRLPAALALVGVIGWIGVALQGRSEALAFAREYAAQQGIAAAQIDAAPRPASPFNWTVFVFDGSIWHVAHVNTRRAAPLVAGPQDNFIRRFSAPYLPLAQAQWQQMPKFGAGADEALAREVWQAPQFAFYRWFAQFPVLHAVDGGPTTCVWYADLRFAFPGRDQLPFRFGLCRESGGAPWQLYSRGDGDERLLAQ
jgi:inner membrane protein